MVKKTDASGEEHAAPAEPKGLQWNIEPVAKLNIGDSISAKTVVSNAFDPEDNYRELYIGGSKGHVGAIKPPYDLQTLDRLSQENNTLSPCIEAMVTNIDGTSFDFIKDVLHSTTNETSIDDTKRNELWSFFAEPWPGESFITVRKKVRRDMERTGNGYMEIIRNLKGEIVFARHVDAKMIRLIKLSDPIEDAMTITRKGGKINMKMAQRYRRFVQLVNGVELRYFKEFGCPHEVDKRSGKFETEQNKVLPRNRSSELLHFTVLPDAHTPYGVPRWISQLPSVLGSRKAEEFNMEFFDNGGVPPVLILLQGGTLGSESRKALEQRVSGMASKKNRVQIVEMEPSGGSLEAPSQARVTVERFGAEKQNDSMFEKYDERCEERVRRSFRLPPLFVGQAADYSFAAAFASYTVAEAQVFRPERDEFDEIISVKLLPALGYEGYLMKSNGLKIEDVTLKLQALELAFTTQQVDADIILEAINAAVGLNLKVSDTLPVPSVEDRKIKMLEIEEKARIRQNQGGGIQSNSTKPKPKATPRRNPVVTKSAEDLFGMIETLTKAVEEGDADAIGDIVDELTAMDHQSYLTFRELLASMSVTPEETQGQHS